ncbi:hypothetical protein PPTG_21242 [Phytophthora nicotianae INRA-310]|uniref:Uncharacterized protein n=1 Tax=Phytophthora nicotianae (strain INRA-310) TaxID=761204 RepID=W2R4I8_PHYN3|nr:hypothetical protein PPTG_21242 [Phytophthora nicotianae INRA-310]ETN20181.1 hypothetical protein PPTG_21242 [Phytophthora nicotianae INRA-310]
MGLGDAVVAGSDGLTKTQAAEPAALRSTSPPVPLHCAALNRQFHCAALPQSNIRAVPRCAPLPSGPAVFRCFSPPVHPPR